MIGRLGGRFRVAEWKEDYMGNDFRVRGQREERVLLSEVGRRERCKDENGGRWVVGVDVTEAPLWRSNTTDSVTVIERRIGSVYFDCSATWLSRQMWCLHAMLDTWQEALASTMRTCICREWSTEKQQAS
jgi:hypothetical protein